MKIRDQRRAIAFISSNDAGSSWGGSEELWSRTALWLAEQGWPIAVNVKDSHPVPAPLQRLEVAGCAVVRRRFQWRHPLWRMAYQRLGQGVFHRWLDGVQPSLAVISLGNSTEGLGWMEACQVRGIPYVLIIHAAAERFWPPDDQAERLAQGYQAAQRCYFVSRANWHLTEKQLAIALSNAAIVANPCHVPWDIQVPWPGTEEGFRLACVGRLQPIAKGQDLILEVLRAEKWRRRPLTVSLVGEGANRRSLQRLQQLWDLGSTIQWTGFVNDVPGIWAHHHALISPSRYEGLPLVLVEAMLCGRPAIVTDVAGHRELLEDGETGFLAIAPTAPCLDEALERAWRERHRWREMGQRAAQVVRQRMPSNPVEVFAGELLALHHRIDGGDRPSP